MNKEKRLYQQGDVLIESIDEIPSDVKGSTKFKNSSKIGECFVLAEGEVTGHFHGISKSDSMLLERPSGETYLKVKSDTDVIHQEHGTITIPAGDYAIRQVKEYDHFDEAVRAVQD